MNHPEPPAAEARPASFVTDTDAASVGDRSSRSPWWVAIGALIAVGGITAAGALLPGRVIDTVPDLGGQARIAAPVPSQSVPPPTVRAATTTVPAARLRQVADHLTTAPYEANPGRFDYVEIRSWQTEPPTGRPPTSVRRIAAWTDNRGSGRSLAFDETTGCVPERDESWTQPQAAPWDGPLSSDPDAVRRQLLGPSPSTSIDLFGQISELFAARIVPLPTRRGLLRMLARQPHTVIGEGVFDPSGQTGITVTTTVTTPAPPPYASYRRILVFDPDTGDLLASGTTTPAAGVADPAVAAWQRPGFLGYTQYVARRHTATRSTPAPRCTEHLPALQGASASTTTTDVRATTRASRPLTAGRASQAGSAR